MATSVPLRIGYAGSDKVHRLAALSQIRCQYLEHLTQSSAHGPIARIVAKRLLRYAMPTSLSRFISLFRKEALQHVGAFDLKHRANHFTLMVQKLVGENLQDRSCGS